MELVALALSIFALAVSMIAVIWGERRRRLSNRLSIEFTRLTKEQADKLYRDELARRRSAKGE